MNTLRLIELVARLTELVDCLVAMLHEVTLTGEQKRQLDEAEREIAQLKE